MLKKFIVCLLAVGTFANAAESAELPAECRILFLKASAKKSRLQTLAMLRTNGLELAPDYARGAGGAPVKTSGDSITLKDLDIENAAEGDRFTINGKRYVVYAVESDEDEYVIRASRTAVQEEGVTIRLEGDSELGSRELEVYFASERTRRAGRRYTISILDEFTVVGDITPTLPLVYVGVDNGRSFTRADGIETMALGDFNIHAPKVGQKIEWNGNNYEIREITGAKSRRTKIEAVLPLRMGMKKLIHIDLVKTRYEGQNVFFVQVAEPEYIRSRLERPKKTPKSVYQAIFAR